MLTLKEKFTMITNEMLIKIIMDKGLLTKKQLEEALPQCGHWRAPFGRVNSRNLEAAVLDMDWELSGFKLVEYMALKKIISEIQAVEFLSNHLELEEYDPQKHILDKDLSELVPERHAYYYGTVPLQKHGDLLKLAMMDPYNPSALRSLEDYTGCELEPVICTEQQLAKIHATLYMGQQISTGERFKGITGTFYTSFGFHSDFQSV